jgi:ATP-dependent Lon protease
VVRLGAPQKIKLTTRFDSDEERTDSMAKLQSIADSLKLYEVELEVKENPAMHDREIHFSNGWMIKIGRGFDIYQRPDDWFQLGVNDLDLRPCLETTVDVFRK